jgi:hypothetical protein
MVLGLLVLLTPPAIELDFIPVIRQLDRLLVGYLSLELFIWLCPPRKCQRDRGGGRSHQSNPVRRRILLLSLRILLLSLAAGIVVALVVLSLADSLLVDLLWFSTLGYRQVFSITISAKLAIFAIRLGSHLPGDLDQRNGRVAIQPRAREASRRGAV